MFCVLFVSGNTGAEAFFIWVRGTKYVQCGDIACELFLTTNPLNMGGENTMPTEHMGATSGGRSFGRGLWGKTRV